METKYHINPETGRAGQCTAKKQCRFGLSENEHFASKEEAKKAYETVMKNDEVSGINKKTSNSLNNNLTTEEFEQSFEESSPQVYDFPIERLSEAKKRIEIANRKAAKAGIEDKITYDYEKYEEIKTDEFGFAVINERVKLTLNKPVLKHDGWTFAGTMGWDDETGLITRMVPGENLISRPEKELCDVCKKVRHRNDTFIVQKDGEQKQVGRNCLKQFMGIKPAGLWMMDYELELKEYDPDDVRAPKGETRRNNNELLAIGLAVYAKKGWVTSARAQATGETPTAYSIKSLLDTNVRKTQEDERFRQEIMSEVEDYKTEAEKLLDEVRQLPGNSEYVQNLRNIANSETVSERNMNILLSAIPTIKAKQDRERDKAEREKNPSQWIGTVGEKIELTKVVVEDVRPIANNFSYYESYTYLISMRTSDGNLVKWFSSRNLDLHTGKEYTLSGRVKKHDQYKDTKQTLITRGKLIED